MATKLYVGGLPYKTTDKELEELFAQHGTVLSASIIMDRATGRSKGFGFVEMEPAEAQAATEALNGTDFGGRYLAINEARPMEPRSPGERKPRDESRDRPPRRY